MQIRELSDATADGGERIGAILMTRIDFIGVCGCVPTNSSQARALRAMRKSLATAPPIAVATRSPPSRPS